MRRQSRAAGQQKKNNAGCGMVERRKRICRREGARGVRGRTKLPATCKTHQGNHDLDSPAGPLPLMLGKHKNTHTESTEKA